MAVPRHLDEAATRLKDASLRIEAAQESQASLDSLKEWLAALTDYAEALKDIQEYSNESVHEKLHELAGRAGLRKFPG
jgi:lysyl-tRNA synthetase class I